MFVNIKDGNYLRDTNSMALINNDQKSKHEYYEKTRLLKSQKEEINNLKNDLTSVKEDVKELKNLIIQLLGKETNG
jgi:cell shape-determining protein MreC